MKAADTIRLAETTQSTTPTVLSLRVGKFIFVQRVTIAVLLVSLISVAVYARAAQNRAAHWKAQAAHLQAQLIQTSLPQAGQNETTWIQNAEAGAANDTQRPDGESEPQLRPGMTRADVERALMPDGGPCAIDAGRYIIGEEPNIYPVAPTSHKVVKVSIHYLPNNLAGMVSSSFSEPRPDDVITSISEPYLEEPYTD